MEKLSTEQKAQRYDSVVGKLKQSMAQGADPLITRADVQDFFPELKESEDERVSREITEFLVDFNNGEYNRPSERMIDSWLSWLEKKGERKPAPRFSIGDYVKDTNYDGEPVYEIACMDRECYICLYRGKGNMGDRAVMHFAFDNPYLRPVQKPTEVGPKFKAGDWVAIGSETDLSTPLRIVDKDGDHYRVEDTNGSSGVPTIEYLDRHYHLWTIRDAKPGDVLYSKKDNNTEIVMCYLGINIHNNVDSYFRYNSKSGFNTYITNVLSTERDSITPATKEQRDLLFQKMEEAGCEWDDVNKELREG